MSDYWRVWLELSHPLVIGPQRKSGLKKCIIQMRKIFYFEKYLYLNKIFYLKNNFYFYKYFYFNKYFILKNISFRIFFF